MIYALFYLMPEINGLKIIINYNKLLAFMSLIMPEFE